MAIESPAHVKLDFFIAGLVVHDGASIKPVRINGAGVICYDGLLKIIADMAGENHIIIPCSIHETIVMSEKTWLDEQVLQEMVYSVNREEVPADEILSDHPFRYEREMNRLCMI